MNITANELYNDLYEQFSDFFLVTYDDYFGSENKLSIDIFKTKYILADNNEITEREKLSPSYVFARWASEAASMERTRELAIMYARLWFVDFYHGFYRPGGSIMAGIGSKLRISLANCTTIPLKGDTLEDISQTSYKMMKAAAVRQGLGVDISKLRPSGAKINNSARISQGPIHFMKYYNSIGDYVGQLGRRPAFLFSISVKHPNVDEFIVCKGDQTTISNANISVQIWDEFMKAVELNSIWIMKFEITATGEVIEKECKARELFKTLCNNAVNFAEPGLQFMDIARRESTTDWMGFPVLSTNACSEKILPADSICMLLSFNLFIFDLSEEELVKIIRRGHRFVDNCVTWELYYNKSPYPEQKYMVEQLREVGCGVTNVANWLLSKNLGYDTDEGIKLITDSIEFLSKTCWQSSIDLGHEKGNCKAFNEMVNKYGLKETQLRARDSGFLARLQDSGIELTALRNAANLSIAPTGSLSTTFPPDMNANDSSGIEPLIALYYWKRNRITGKFRWFFCISSRVHQWLIENGYPEAPLSVEDNSGEIGIYWKKIIDKHFDPKDFRPAHEINPLKKVEMMGRIAKWVDSSISVTYNLPETATAETVEELYMQAWKAGIKSISVYRDKSRTGIIEVVPPKEAEARYEKVSVDKLIEQAKPTTLGVVSSVVRPEDLPCKIHRTVADGKKFIVFVGLYEGKPYEVFATAQDTLKLEDKLPVYVNDGIIRKLKTDCYELIRSDKKLVVSHNLGEAINNPEYSDITRLISTSLRYGVPVDEVVKQLTKTRADISSFVKAIRRVLIDYVDEQYSDVKICTICNSPNLIKKEGCVSCLDCGSSVCG